MKKETEISQLFRFAGKHKILTISSWILAAASAILALVPLVYIWKILDEVFRVAPNFAGATNITYYGWMSVLFAFISMLVYVSGLMCSHLAAFRIAKNIRKNMMEHITTLPIGFMEDFGSGKMRKIINESSAATEGYLAHQLPDHYAAITTPIGLLVLLMVFDWRLGLLSLLPVVFGFLIAMRMVGASSKVFMETYQNALEDMSNEAVEYIRGVPVVKAFGQTVFSFKRFKESIDRYFKYVMQYTISCRKLMIAYTTVINSVFAFLIAGAMFFSAGNITQEFILNLLFYIIITPIISVTLTRIMYQSENKRIVQDALKRIDSILEIKPLSSANKPKSAKGSGISIQNVSFGYEVGSNVLHNISIDISAGSTVAFVGPSGGGKTTLASLIARFYDVGSGSISIGGVDIRNIAKEELMNIVSFVFQDSKLLKMSISENVRLGRPSASRDQVLNALHAAQCTDIIEKFSDGIDTVIGSKGVYLSGGEQQRISIARAILKDSPVIVLDEATAFADPDNESKVQAALAVLAKGKTVIIIAHRLSTVVGVDEICVLSAGKMVEQGTHQQLLTKNGIYSSMWNNYIQSADWKVGKAVAQNA